VYQDILRYHRIFQRPTADRPQTGSQTINPSRIYETPILSTRQIQPLHTPKDDTINVSSHVRRSDQAPLSQQWERGRG
jgi:hypothetical protein